MSSCEICDPYIVDCGRVEGQKKGRRTEESCVLWLDDWEKRTFRFIDGKGWERPDARL